jgi:cytochrome c oxidase subunit 1
MGVGMFMVLANLIHSLIAGRRAPANPWGSNSLEWHAASPPPHDNFAVTPHAGDPYDYSGWHWSEQTQAYERVAAAEPSADPAKQEPAHP